MAHLTIIDIAPLFHEDRHARRVIDERIGRAILEAGGFVIANYPDADRVDARALTLLEFFELSNEIKFSVASRAMNPEGSRIYRGYFASLGPDSWAHNEIYDIGPEDPVGGPAILGMDIFAETNIWPAVEPVPGWRQAMRAYRDHMGTVARAVMLSISRAAGFTDEDLLSRFEGGNSTLRLLNYPARSGSSKVVNEFPDDRFIDDEGLTLATGRHLRHHLNRFGILRGIDFAAFSDEVGCYKPDPSIFRAAMHGLGVDDPSSVVHVGDLRRTDVAGARALGMGTVRFRGAIDDPEPGDEADHVVDRLGELPDLLAARA